MIRIARLIYLLIASQLYAEITIHKDSKASSSECKRSAN